MNSTTVRQGTSHKVFRSYGLSNESDFSLTLARGAFNMANLRRPLGHLNNAWCAMKHFGGRVGRLGFVWHGAGLPCVFRSCIGCECKSIRRTMMKGGLHKEGEDILF